MNLDTQNWKPFLLKDIYEIQMGNGFDKNKMDEDTSEINFVSRQSYNNGVDTKVDYVEGVEPFSAGLVTVALGGSYLGSCFVQDEPFYTAQNVAVMKPKFTEMTDAVNIFISGLVRYESSVKYYAFGRELNTHIRTDFDIKLPVDSNGDPDWQFMEDYIKSLHHEPLTTKNKSGQVPALNVHDWKEFRVGDILDVINGKGLTTEEIEENGGDIPCVQGGESENGSIGNISRDYVISQKYVLIDEPCLTVARVGTAGCVNYWEESCAIGDKCKALLLKSHKSKPIYIFIQTLLNQLQYKYSYGRGLVTEKYMDDIIKLPADLDGNPDWRFMEDYIKSLPYGDRLAG